MEVSSTYLFYELYTWLRAKLLRFSTAELHAVVGTTAHYGLPDFRLNWNKYRVVSIIPRPKGVCLFLEYRKFMRHRSDFDQGEIDQFEDACGALPNNKNGLITLHAIDDVDEEYLDTFLRLGIALHIQRLKSIH